MTKDGIITTSELLREETREALIDREGHWNPFTEQVMARIDAEDRLQAQVGLERQISAALSAEADRELVDLASRFEGGFLEEVEGRIFREGMETRDAAETASTIAEGPSWLERLRAWWAAPVAFAGAAAAALLVLAPFEERPAELGEVWVDKLDIDGTATVVAEEGLTVVWVQSPG